VSDSQYGGDKRMQIRKRRNSLSATILFTILVLTFGATASKGAEKTETDCKMIFNLSGWSILYETASGTGSIKCDNGQSSVVNLQVRGGGITAGKYKLRGKGDFSKVSDISELYGTYAAAEAHAGVIKSANAEIVTKGTVSLALAAKGRGINLGVGFSGFSIEPLKKGQRVYDKDSDS
jgi:hypothetical protein